jgi:hypothetical protein
MSTIPTVPYADSIYAAEYFAERMGTTAWDSASVADRNKALKHATRLIDSCEFVLEKTDETQDHEFPRDGDLYVPEEVLQACCEVALELLKGRLPEEMSISKAGVTSESIGDTSRSYDANGALAPLGMAAGLPSIRAAQLLRKWLVDETEIDLLRVN